MDIVLWQSRINCARCSNTTSESNGRLVTLDTAPHLELSNIIISIIISIISIISIIIIIIIIIIITITIISPEWINYNA